MALPSSAVQARRGPAAPTPLIAAPILLVDDYAPNLLALEVVLESLGHPLVRATSAESAIARLLETDFAVALLDVEMPGADGMAAARRIRADPRIRHVPIVFMTAQSYDESRVAAAYSLGAVDYIQKPFHPDILRAKVAVFVELFEKRAELRRSEQLRFDQARAVRERQAALTMDVGVALTRSRDVRAMLQLCTDSMVNHLEAAFARIWTVSPTEPVLELQASSGLYTHLDGGHARVPVGQFKIGLIAEENRPHLTNDIQSDPRLGDPAWAVREGLVSFAGYPLCLGTTVVGVMAMFSRQPLERDVVETLGVVADSIALGIQRERSEAGRLELVARMQHHNDQLQGLAEAALAISSATSLEDLLELVADQARLLTGADSAVATLLASDRQPLEQRAASPRQASVDVPTPGGPTPALVATLNSTDGPLGRIELTGKARGGAFSDGDRGIVWQLAQVSSAAIENRRLYEEALEAEHRQRELNRALERTNRELDEFAYVASHDLKAPLRGIANLSEWIEEDLGDAVTDSAREQLGLLRGRVMRLEALIDGILDYSRAGRTQHKTERVDLGELLAGAVELMAPPPEVQIVLPPDLPTWWTERVPLTQIFMNLIGNALKHGRRPPDRSEFRIEVTYRDCGSHGEFLVVDNGPGIAPEYHERIWGIFQTLERRDQVEGTGIGLSVVKKSVEIRGGRVWIESSPGEGTTFGFSWPSVPAT